MTTNFSDRDFILFRDAVNKWGIELQIACTIEECSELTKVLCKILRKHDAFEQLPEEIADVEIMIQQLKQHYDLQRKVDYHICKKLARLRERVETSL